MRVIQRQSDRVVVKGSLPMAPQTVFEAFTQPDRLITWWPDEAETDVKVGGAFRLSWPQQDWTLRGRYLEVRPPGRLRFTWSWDHEDIPERTVTMDFAAAGENTELTIAHTCGSAEEGQSYIDAWDFFVSRLVS